jgi:hypothetical protein
MSLLDSSERETFYILLNSYEMKEQSQRSIILSKKNEIASKFELMEFQIGSVVLVCSLYLICRKPSLQRAISLS